MNKRSSGLVLVASAAVFMAVAMGGSGSAAAPSKSSSVVIVNGADQPVPIDLQPSSVEVGLRSIPGVNGGAPVSIKSFDWLCGGGGCGVRESPSEVVVTRYADKSTKDLMQALAQSLSGTFGPVTIELVQDDQVYVRFRFTGVLPTNISIGMVGALDKAATESLTFAFSDVETTFP